MSQEEFTLELLRSKRLEKHLTQKQLAKITATSIASLSNYERGVTIPTQTTLKRIKFALEKETPTECTDTWQSPPPVLPPPPPKYEFELGHVYIIRQEDVRSNPSCDIQPCTGWNCEFKYEGKRGIHHNFRETSGGWTRTYTDAQLVDKLITEVKK